MKQVVAHHAVEDDELLVHLAQQALPLARLNAEDARKLVQCQRAAGLPEVIEHVIEEGSRFGTEAVLLDADRGRVAVEEGKALAYTLAVPPLHDRLVAAFGAVEQFLRDIAQHMSGATEPARGRLELL